MCPSICTSLKNFCSCLSGESEKRSKLRFLCYVGEALRIKAPITKLYIDLPIITRFSSKTDLTWQNHIFGCAQQIGGSRHVAAVLVYMTASVSMFKIALHWRLACVFYKKKQRGLSKYKWRTARHLRSVSELWLRSVTQWAETTKTRI